MHKGHPCRLGFRLSSDGGLQLLAHRQRPDLGDREDGARVCCCGVLRRALALGDGLLLLPAVQVEPPCSPSSPWCAASGAAPTARGSRGHAPGARCRLSPTPCLLGGLVVGQRVLPVRQGCGRREHGADGFQAPVALLRVRGDPHLVVVTTFQQDHGDGAGGKFACWGPCTCRLRVPLYHAREVTPLSRAVLLSHSARPSYGGMWRVSPLGGGAARSRPRTLGAGLESVGGAMSVCAQPGCGTHMPPWSGWWVLNHQIHASTRWSVICVPGVTEPEAAAQRFRLFRRAAGGPRRRACLG